ncbi:polyisoprenoid-binding protein YceI [Amycolatopsis lexingtonensis]|uniref:Polyisoprenoid-binding protein YceI n=1 Tax=Amycolatopsis lexingtonensis TaxID=218822 RepID=A0ABR9HXW4_9PSEU|nr:YceI family protein [Amycolatopsis lexingtonensis]MBE1495769.1 polyisoprenoid-binding protein YceI [Amycolatopsis lexingtonensis]
MITTTSETASRPPRKRRWLRRTLIALAALVVLLVAAVVLYVKLAPVPAPLALPATTSAPTGPLAGQWDVTTGSAAGFRIQQTVLFVSNDVVQRTGSVAGSLTIADDQATAARFTVDLTTLTTNGKPTPQLAISLDTARYPEALVTLAAPQKVDATFASGDAVTETVAGQLMLRGRTHPVTITLTARRDGDLLRTAGTIPVTFADWDIPSPAGYGPFGSLADHGIAEFSLVLHRH